MLYLTLRHYEYVTAIAQAGSLSGAAGSLNVSQPSLSIALDTIEARIGTALFLRGRGKGLTITPQGRQFVVQANDVLARAARLERSGQTPLPHSEIGLGCFNDLAPFLLAPTLSLLRGVMPDVALRPVVGDFSRLITDMEQGRVDLAITWDVGLDNRFTRTVLGVLRPSALFAQGHPMASARTVALADLAGEPLILSGEGLSAQHMIRLCAQAGFAPDIAHRAASTEVMRALAAHGEGVGLSYCVPPGACSYDGRPLVAVPLQDDWAAESVVLTQLGKPVEGDSLSLLTKAVVAGDLLS